MNQPCAHRRPLSETLLLVWEVREPGHHVSGVTDDPANALVNLVQELRACLGEARAIMRPARLHPNGRPEYAYGPILIHLHRDPATGKVKHL
ncbi:hypothetical protein [Spongiactinospora sp. 9N601]|uniref:hypothetical protein n=1 Tax=Spongiactinospora sp. 9N601 TaxID=3375149 RepID=UPI0037ABDCED